MILHVLETFSILLAAGVMAMFLGPWAALTRSLDQFEPAVFIPLIRRLSGNMAQVMTMLMPLSLLAILPVLALTYATRPAAFAANLIALLLFGVAVVVTTAVEIPLVRQMEGWTPATLPDKWRQVRDRWLSFHGARIACGISGLTLLVIAGVSL